MIIFKHKIKHREKRKFKKDIVMKKEMNEKMELIKKLLKNEDDIMYYECELKDTSDPDRKKEIQKNLDFIEYHYKVDTIELTTEDREEIYNLALENDVELLYIKTLVFTEEEKEEWLSFEDDSDSSCSEIPGWDEAMARMEESILRVNKATRKKRKWSKKERHN